MYVACQNAGWGVRVPIANFLQETRKAINETACTPNVRTRALSRLRKAWAALASRDDWEACVHGIASRAIIVEDESPDMHELQAIVLCAAIREAFPLAPPGFEKIGRSATKAEPGSIIAADSSATDSEEDDDE